MRADMVRRFALSLPEAEERETWETATFRIRDRIFLMFSERERHAWIKSTHDEQRALISQDPGTFFAPPYVGPSGWVGVVIRTVDPDELRELVTEGWRMTAPKRVVAAFDEGTG
ncbi:MAG TPA: MmcQ/YjbR family DNA-binding protein [Actinomycetota bacterium]|nr:MmcQ/YjbR family DNA-binding protein [Actinomycetota bacterium]